MIGSPDSLLEFVRADPLFHPVEEGRPGVGPEGDGPFFRLLRPAGGTSRFPLADLHDPLENMTADCAFIFIDWQGSLGYFRSPEGSCVNDTEAVKCFNPP